MWAASLPHTFLAFFYPSGERCERAPSCRARAEADHRRFESIFAPRESVRARDEHVLPLLVLDQTNWHAPFSVAPGYE